MLRQRANGLLDLLSRHTGPFRRLLDMLGRNTLGRIEVGPDTIQVLREDNPAKFGMLHPEYRSCAPINTRAFFE